MARLVALLLVVVLAGCMRPPRPVAGTFPPLTVAEAQQQPHTGERVRWGGDIVATTPNDDGTTCFEVVSKPLDSRARPRRTDDTFGRFFACATGFYDPSIWAADREMTAAGSIEGTRQGKVGDYEYPFPVVRADGVYLWPERRTVDQPVIYSPWIGWGPYWGPYWGGGWY